MRNSRLLRMTQLVPIYAALALNGCSHYNINGYRIEKSAFTEIRKEFRYAARLIDTDNNDIITEEEVRAFGEQFREVLDKINKINEKITGLSGRS